MQALRNRQEKRVSHNEKQTPRHGLQVLITQDRHLRACDVADVRHSTTADLVTNVTQIAQPDVLPMPHHLRAARALLGWSMDVLARASALSNSTVKRLEEDRALVSRKSRLRATVALGKAGIRFIAINHCIVGVANADETSAAVRAAISPSITPDTEPQVLDFEIRSLRPYGKPKP